MSIPPPPLRDPFHSNAWLMWFQAVYQALRLPTAGTTAGRPSVGLFAGQMYFDTDLGKPIWFDGSLWRDATGGVV